ncbi:hypothetical protein [Paenibacillus aestuarii]|uniref:Uncharacterized protein n=1 Tax=Paenibacillus aestuarii TaxID=516965 RepID=A0ABW0K0M8_9BACL|nr:hypothetical protein [Paenibacillus aestuarii]
MKWGLLCGIIAIVALIFVYEWPKISSNMHKEKVAFIVFSVIACLLAGLLIFFPDIPGPTMWVETVYKPLGKLLEHP